MTKDGSDPTLQGEIQRLLSNGSAVTLETYLKLAKRCQKQGELEAALTLLLKAERTYPKQANLLCDIANLCYELKQFDKANTYYTKSVYLEPKQLSCWFQLATLYAREKQSRDVINSLSVFFGLLLGNPIGLDDYNSIQQNNTDSQLLALIELVEDFVTNRNFLALPAPSQPILIELLTGLFYSSQHPVFKQKIAFWKNFYCKLLDANCPFQLPQKIYNLLRFIYWSNHESAEELKSFNADVVIPLQTYLKRHVHSLDCPARTQIANQGAPYHLAYIINKLEPISGNAIPTIVSSQLEGHLQLNNPNFKIVVYVTGQTPNPDHYRYFEEKGMAIRNLSNMGNNIEDKLKALHRHARDEQFDIVIYDVNLSFQTYCVVSRLAPIQIYWSMGFNEWDLENLDYYLITKRENKRVINRKNKPCIEREQLIQEKLLDKPIDQETLKALQTMLPSNKIILGTHGRLMKLSTHFCHTVKAILERCPQACYIAAGTGNASHLKQFIAENQLEGSFFLMDKFVDGQAFLAIIDIFLDTFPVFAGVAGTEALYRGKPIIHHIHPEERGGWEATEPWRDRDLSVDNSAAYVETCVSLIDDKKRCLEAGGRAREKAKRFIDLCAGTREYENELLKLIHNYSAGTQ